MKNRTPEQLLSYLNETYYGVHFSYENKFWISYMGDHGVDKKMAAAQAKRDAFRSDVALKAEVDAIIPTIKRKKKLKDRLMIWSNFFSLFQTPAHALAIKDKVTELERKIHVHRVERKEGYIDPKSGEFVSASENKMRGIMRTDSEEAVRKACFDAMEKLPLVTLGEYVEMINARNEFARALGYEDFYDYKIHIDEGMTKPQLFGIFENIYEKTKYALDNIRELEKAKPGLRKPWNFGYMLTGDFTKEADPYFQFENAVSYWGRSFSALGVNFQGGTIKLDLLDRKGKYSNGFCHWPVPVHYDFDRKKEKIIPGTSQFTSNAIPGQIGSGVQGIHTLFHEGGHAAHYLNSIQKDICLNTEYPPSTVSWSETQSMFMDTVSSSIEWNIRYARDKDGKAYPFDLYERQVRALHALRPLGMMGIIYVVFFEKEIYECKNLTPEFVLETAKKMYKKYFDRSEDSISILNVPHIYSWESSAYYHGYGLAELGVHQWRDYFFKKYGYIVDNPNVGKEMAKVWKYGALYPSNKLIKLATGKSLSPDAFIKNATQSVDETLKGAKLKIERLAKVPLVKKPVKLNAKIVMVHGKKKIADNKKSFEDMEKRYRSWVAKKK